MLPSLLDSQFNPLFSNCLDLYYYLFSVWLNSLVFQDVITISIESGPTEINACGVALVWSHLLRNYLLEDRNVCGRIF